MATATARLLVGRKIAGFEPRPFDDRRGGTAHHPVLMLDNGALLRFVVEETDTGDYGVLPVYVKPPQRRK